MGACRDPRRSADRKCDISGTHGNFGAITLQVTARDGRVADWRQRRGTPHRPPQLVSVTACQYWKGLVGAEPTPAEFNLFARVIPYFGGDNSLAPLFVHMIHLTHKDVGSIECEILEKGPSALQQAREMIDEFNKVLRLLNDIRSAILNLSLDHDDIMHSLRELDRRKKQRVAEHAGWLRKFLLGRHLAAWIASASVEARFASFVGTILAAYVLSGAPWTQNITLEARLRQFEPTTLAKQGAVVRSLNFKRSSTSAF